MADVAELGAWENIISQHINGAPQPMMLDAVRDATIEFCRDTRVDRRGVFRLPVLVTVPDTLLPDGEDGEFPGTVITVWSDEGRISPMTHRDLEEVYPGGYMQETVDDIRNVAGWISLRPGSVRLVGRPNIDSLIDLEVAYQPKRNATAVPMFLYEMFAYEIGYGALAILHAHASASYADPGLAGQYKTLFNGSKARVANLGESGFQKPRRRTRLDRTFDRRWY